jgi:hypothetical protein
MERVQEDIVGSLAPEQLEQLCGICDRIVEGQQ